MSVTFISVPFMDILEFWAVGYVVDLVLMVIVCLSVNRKFLKDWVNWIILILLSILSWLGFAFALFVICVAYIEYIKNKYYDKDSEK